MVEANSFFINSVAVTDDVYFLTLTYIGLLDVGWYEL